MLTLIVLPTYNERDTIAPLLAAIEREVPRACVLVVDDSSPDGTGEVVRADERYGFAVFLLERDLREGVGAAYREGFTWALDHGYEAVVQMDADLSHPPELLGSLLEGLEQADIVIGSRYVCGGHVADWSLPRRVVSWVGNACVRRALHLGTHDVTAGFKAFRASALRDIDVLSSTSDAFSFQVESTWHAERRGLSVVEVPITFTERKAGQTKMSSLRAVRAVSQVVIWRLQEVREIAVHLRRGRVHAA